jgi:type IV secretory pathway TrbL component
VNSVRDEGNAMTTCTSCQILDGPTQLDCSQNQATTCQDLLDGTAGPVAGFQSSLVASAAPASLSAADTRLQQDLAQADSALIAMSAALSRGDQAGFNAGRVTLRSAFSAVDRDVSVI